MKDRERPNKPLVRRSDKMANIAKEYHDNLQKEDMVENVDEHGKRTTEVLRHVRRKLSKNQKELLATNVTEKEVKNAINSLPNGKAAGLDGIPQEIWKHFLNERQNEEEELKKNPQKGAQENDLFDVVKYLTTIYNNIENNGAAPETGFADGWLCPIYKKGNRTDIENYRPITVLNTDYKIFTKAMANRLAMVTPD